jgi:hypothetical protein
MLAAAAMAAMVLRIVVIGLFLSAGYGSHSVRRIGSSLAIIVIAIIIS